MWRERLGRLDDGTSHKVHVRSFENLKVHKILFRLGQPDVHLMRWNIHPHCSSHHHPASEMAARQGALVGPALGGGRRAHKTLALGVKCNGSPQQLGFFLVQVWTYMVEYGSEIPTKEAKVRCVTMVLEGPAAQWMVFLHNDNSLELRNLNHFIAIFRKLLEDSLADCNARDHIKIILQGHPAQKPTPGSAKEPTNPPSWTQETALEGVQVIEFSLSPGRAMEHRPSQQRALGEPRPTLIMTSW